MKMPTREKARNKKQIAAIIVVTATIIAVAVIGYLYFSKGSLLGWSPFGNHADTDADSSINYNQASEDQKSAGADIKQNSTSSSNPDAKPSDTTDRPAAPVPQQNGKSKVDIVITAANQVGSSLQVRSDIGVVTNSGTCTLALTKGKLSIARTAGVQALSSTSTCQGFDIPTSELSPGAWSIDLHFENATLTGDANQTVTIR